MGTRAVQGDEVRLLRCRKLPLLAAQTPLRSGDRHALASTSSDEICLELGDHAEHIEQQPANGIGRVLEAATEAKAHALRRELVCDIARIRQRSRELIELQHHEGVPLRQAARASRRPGRARFVPVSPWSTWSLRSSTPSAISVSRQSVRFCSTVRTRAYPISMPRL